MSMIGNYIEKSAGSKWLLEFMERVGEDDVFASDDAFEMANRIHHRPGYFRLSVFENMVADGSEFKLYILSSLDDMIHAEAVEKAAEYGYIDASDTDLYYTCYVFPKDVLNDMDNFYNLVGDYIGSPMLRYVYKDVILVCASEIDTFPNTELVKAMGKPESAKEMLIDVDDETGELTDVLQESVLSEMRGRGGIDDDRILRIIDDSIKDIESLGYEIGDDIDYRWGDTLHTFGSMNWPSVEGDNFMMVLNRHMANEPEAAIKNVICHEFAHYIQMKGLLKNGIVYWKWGKGWVGNSSRYVKSRDSGHGSDWSSIAARISSKIGTKIERTDSYSTHTGVGEYAKKRYKYVVRCKNCGNELEYAKMTDFVKDPNQKSKYGDWYRWQCGECHAKGQWEVLVNGAPMERKQI